MADKKSSDAAKAAMAAMGAVGQYDPAALLSLYSMTAAYGGIGGMTAPGGYTAASPGLFINTIFSSHHFSQPPRNEAYFCCY